MERVLLIIYGEYVTTAVSIEDYLQSPAEVNELIDELVKAKNQAFPGGYAEHKAKMEALGGDRHDQR